MNIRKAPLEIGSTIGIIGDGQLGKMLSMAASSLGFKTCIYANSLDSIASQVSCSSVVGAHDNFHKLEYFAKNVDIITCETENIPLSTLDFLADHGKVIYPDRRAFLVSQNRLLEKQFLSGLQLSTAFIGCAASASDIKKLAHNTPLPWILKTTSGGYDGRGQVVLHDVDNAIKTLEEMHYENHIIEKKLDFAREVSVIIYRSIDGKIGIYDICENVHENGILRSTRAGETIKECKAACDIASRIVEALDYVGVMGVEFFHDTSNNIIVNEIAPRVHNTGHWTLDACLCSQFEQHIRMICGWEAGSTKRLYNIEMTNIIGDEISDWPLLSSMEDTNIYIYGKKDMFPGRKMGHRTKLV